MSDTDNDDAGKEMNSRDESEEILQVDVILDEKLTYAARGQTDLSEVNGDSASSEISPGENPETRSSADEKLCNTDDRKIVAIEQQGSADVLNEIRNLHLRMDELATHFEGKIKYDAHKNRIIDDLHDQLKDFRDGIIKKHLFSMITDIIKIIDDTRKVKAHYETKMHTEDGTVFLLDFMDQIISDLEDLFTFQGIYPFTFTENTFDSARQRIIKKINTDDPEKNRLVAESLRPGYEWEGKVIRPEMISIYVHNDSLNDKAGES